MRYKTDRTASEIQKSLSMILQNELRNPDVSPLTSITGVTVSKDLKYSTVYVSSMGDVQKTVSALNSSAGFLRRALASELKNMRTVPSLTFKVDGSVEYGRKIDAILKEISDESNS